MIDRPVILAVCLAGALAGNAAAQQNGNAVLTDPIVPPPPTYKAGNVTVDEHLGALLPLDGPFLTHDGKPTTLGGALHVGGDRPLPAIITFNYSDCPLLCSLQLNGLATAIPELAKDHPGRGLRLGVHYRIVTISLDPHETTAKLARMRQKYLDKLPADQRDDAAAGWTFLSAATPGDDTQIRRVARVVGFSYTYLEDRAEWAHPAAFTFVSMKGAITRYVYGIELPRAAFQDSVMKAGLAEPSSALGYMHLCYFYDPDANNHSRGALTALRIGAAGAVVLLLAGLGLLWFLRRGAWRQTPDRRWDSSGEAT